LVIRIPVSREYIQRALKKVREIRLSTPVIGVRRTLTGQVIVRDAHQRDEAFDHIVFACHGDQALRLLQDHTAAELDILQHVRYKPNRAVVHRDRKVRIAFFRMIIRAIWLSLARGACLGPLVRAS